MIAYGHQSLERHSYTMLYVLDIVRSSAMPSRKTPRKGNAGGPAAPATPAAPQSGPVARATTIAPVAKVSIRRPRNDFVMTIDDDDNVPTAPKQVATKRDPKRDVKVVEKAESESSEDEEDELED